MSMTRSEIQDGIGELLRSSAQRYGDAVTQYGDAVTRYGAAFVAYGKGEIDAMRVVETTLRLFVSETRNVVETSVSLGAAYSKWAASVVGIRDLGTVSKAAEASAPRPKSEKSKA